MLICKPFFLSRFKSSNNPHHFENPTHENTSEIYIHQVIETIEYVLGSISNTASYLRLWALSLAHQQLSAVFYSLLIEPALQSSDASLLHIVFSLATRFAIFMIVSIGVIMVMDTMECCLHAMRLHWIEFMGKFYQGDGYAFTRLSCRTPSAF